LSPWEPDPITALEAVAARQRDGVGKPAASSTGERLSVEHHPSKISRVAFCGQWRGCFSRTLPGRSILKKGL